MPAYKYFIGFGFACAVLFGCKASDKSNTDIKSLLIGKWVDKDSPDEFLNISADTVWSESSVMFAAYTIEIETPCNTQGNGYWFGFKYGKNELFGNVSLYNDTLKFHDPMEHNCEVTRQFVRVKK